MYENTKAAILQDVSLLNPIPYKIWTFKLVQLIQTGIFKENRQRSFIITAFDQYLAAQGLKKWTKRKDVVLRFAIPLIQIHHDLRPALMLMLIERNLTVKELAGIFDVAPGQIWKRPQLLRSMQTILRCHEFMRKKHH